MMEKLPQEIAFEIFYRLPPESVVRCKFVCKSWLSILPRGDDDGNYFANMHLRLRRRRHHQQQQRNLDDYSTFNCIALERDNDQDEEGSLVGEFHFAEYNEVEGLHCTVKRLAFSQICISGWLMSMSMTRLVGSCNGLLCFTLTYRGETKKDSFKDRIGICNPLLHEYVFLPISELEYLKYRTGFGHNPITDEYKLVRVCYRHSHSDIGDVEVYTLGKSSSNGAAGMWRSKGTIQYKLRIWSTCVLINGSIHWLAHTGSGSKQYIVSFDLEDEEFRVIPVPSNLNISWLSKLRELRGCLCLIQINLDIWVLKDYMNKESWVKEFSIKWAAAAVGSPCYSPVAIKKNKKDGDDAILCWCNSKSGKRLVSYDPKTQKFKKVGGKQDVNGLIFNSVLHINSLVSLKALGEDAKYAKESSPSQGPWPWTSYRC